jgi:hypothetical protein
MLFVLNITVYIVLKNIVRLQGQEECTELMDVEVIASTRHKTGL